MRRKKKREGIKRKPHGRHGEKKEIIILCMQLKSLLCKRRPRSAAPFYFSQARVSHLLLALFLAVSTRTKTRRRGTPSLPSAWRVWRRLARLQTRSHRLGMCWRSKRACSSALHHPGSSTSRLAGLPFYSCYVVHPQQGFTDYYTL